MMIRKSNSSGRFSGNSLFFAVFLWIFHSCFLWKSVCQWECIRIRLIQGLGWPTALPIQTQCWPNRTCPLRTIFVFQKKHLLWPQPLPIKTKTNAESQKTKLGRINAKLSWIQKLVNKILNFKKSVWQTFSSLFSSRKWTFFSGLKTSADVDRLFLFDNIGLCGFKLSAAPFWQTDGDSLCLRALVSTDGLFCRSLKCLSIRQVPCLTT
jgi:hypothetical protein